MRVLHRYILAEMAWPFVGGLLMFTFLLLVTQLFRLADLLINQGVSASLVLGTLATLLPQIVAITAPMALLLAVLQAFGRLAGDKEVMAIRASGISLWSLYTPVLVVGALMTALMYPFLVDMVPRNKAALTGLKGELLFALTSIIGPGTVHNPDTIDAAEILHLRYEERGENPGEMKRAMVHMVTGAASAARGASRNEVIILARDGSLLPDPDNRSSLALTLKDGEIHVFDKYAPEAYNIVRFSKLKKSFHLDVDRRGKRGLRSDEMTMAQLRDSIAGMEPGVASIMEAGGPRGEQQDNFLKRYNNARVEKWTRMSMPLACLAFVMIGMPLGVFGRTSAKATGFAVAFALLFVYYILLQWGTSLGQDGHPLAFYAIFSPNIVLALLGGFLLVKTANQ